MNKYFKTAEKVVDFNSESEVADSYNQGFVFTRLGKGRMDQTRSLRIDLSKFELSSENKRILNKTESLSSDYHSLPLEDYSWEIHKMGKEFYSKKFGDGTMSAQKIKEMFTDMQVSNMNGCFTYYVIRNTYDVEQDSKVQNSQTKTVAGYCLCHINSEIIHYAYPFYDLESAESMPNIGLGMMLRAIIWAKENGKKYIYLGSIVGSSSKYKLQFEGLEWWDTEKSSWLNDLEELKNLLVN